MRTTVCVKGRFVGDEQNKFQYIARITAWAGRSDVHVKYAWPTATRTTTAYRQVKDSTIALKLAGAPAAAVARRRQAARGRRATRGCSSRCAVVQGRPIHKNDTCSGRVPRVPPTPDACVAMAGGAEAVGSAAAKPLANPPGAVKATNCPRAGPRQGRRAARVRHRPLLRRGPAAAAGGRRGRAPAHRASPSRSKAPSFRSPRPTRWLFDCSHLSSQYVLDFAAPADPAALSAKPRKPPARRLHGDGRRRRGTSRPRQLPVGHVRHPGRRDWRATTTGAGSTTRRTVPKAPGGTAARASSAGPAATTTTSRASRTPSTRCC